MCITPNFQIKAVRHNPVIIGVMQQGKVDSKTVNAQIRKVIRPLLKELGFSRFTSRNSWRFSDARIDVVNFQSFNSYNASVLGCTTYSFSVNLGCYFTHIPHQCGSLARIKEKDGQPCPEEYDCQFRGRLTRSFTQPESPSQDIWYIDPEGQSIGQSLNDISSQITAVATPWFQRLADQTEVLRILTEDDIEMETLWGFGNKASPIRNYLTGYFALRTGKLKVAKEHLRKALESKCFDAAAIQIEQDIAAA